MNRKNKGGGGRTPSPNPAESILWSKVDKDKYAGGLVQPGYAGDAGFDLCASEDVIVPGNGFAQIPTNVAVCIPHGYWGQLVGRSSTFFKRRLLVQTAVIDNGYRGQLWCVVRNMCDTATVVRRKERVMQLILHELHVPPVVEVPDLSPSERGAKGFGSTGIEVSE